jgi:A/G-specific adenine glycosylase
MRVANYTQAIMDLGATVCNRSQPVCTACPLQRRCQAFATNRVSDIPAPKPRKEKPRRATVMLMAVNSSGDILLVKRPPSGIWGGLWSFPELQSTDEITDWCRQRFTGKLPQQHEWPAVAHTFSHFHLDMTPVEVRVDAVRDEVMDGDRWLWYNTRSPAGIGLAAPVTKLLQQIDDRHEGHGENNESHR